MHTTLDYDEYLMGDSCPPISDISSDEEDSMIDDDDDEKCVVAVDEDVDGHACQARDEDEDDGDVVAHDDDGGDEEVGDDETQPPEPLSVQPFTDFSCSLVPDTLDPAFNDSFVPETQLSDVQEPYLVQNVMEEANEGTQNDDEYYPFVEEMLCILVEGWRDMDPEKKRRRRK